MHRPRAFKPCGRGSKPPAVTKIALRPRLTIFVLIRTKSRAALPTQRIAQGGAGGCRCSAVERTSRSHWPHNVDMASASSVRQSVLCRTESRASWRRCRHKGRPAAIREFLNSTQGLVVNASSAHRGHSSACTCGHCRKGMARYGQSCAPLDAKVQAVKRSRALADAARNSGKSW
jgi:hypothetical protein